MESTMSLMTITAESLTRDLGKEVPAMYVVVAKHKVLGSTDESICEVIDCTKEELGELESDPLFKEVRQIVGAMQLQTRVNSDTGLDALESMAVQKLVERLPFEKDPEFILRVAAFANKAQRRTAPQQGILDPARSGQRTTINLTSRILQRLTQTGTEVVKETHLSIRDGSMTNPKFEEVDDLLSVSERRGVIPHVKTIESRDVSFEELDETMKELER
jgi:hypothetical protein